MSVYKYKTRYTLTTETKPNGYTKSDVENEDQGLCDNIVLISILNPPDGSYSQLILSMDGDTGNYISQDDLFKVWMMMGLMLTDNKKLTGWKKDINDFTSENIRKLFSNTGEPQMQ